MRSLTAENLNILRNFQKEIAKKVILDDRFRTPISRVAGIDLAFKGDQAVTACAVMAFPSLKHIFHKKIMSKLEFPYITTFLSFREGPPIVEIIGSLDVKPDVFLINAQGIAHTLFCGCASHVGVQTQCPTIGVAQTNLCGEYNNEPRSTGEYVPMYYQARNVGWVFKSKQECRPIFISPGHLVSLESSIEIVRRCMGKYKLPLPLHYAHKFAIEEKGRFSITSPR